MAPRYLTQADLENIVGTERVLQLFDEDTDGSLGASELQTLADILEQAEGEVDSRLKLAYSTDAITTLAGSDLAVKRHAAWIAMEFAAERREEFLGEGGTGPYEKQYERAIKFFEQLAKGRQRSKGEADAGLGANVGGTVQPTLPTGTPRFTFAPDNDNPTGHGGF